LWWRCELEKYDQHCITSQNATGADPSCPNVCFFAGSRYTGPGAEDSSGARRHRNDRFHDVDISSTCPAKAQILQRGEVTHAFPEYTGDELPVKDISSAIDEVRTGYK